MSHFATLVLTDSNADVEKEVERLLAPFDENEECFREGSRWDWWQIGGRWTGAISADYDPKEDPDNWETCSLCNGSGERPGGREQFGDFWYEACGGCNGCLGRGWRVKWATQWKRYDGDVRPVAAIRFKRYENEDGPWEFVPHAVVTLDGKWHEQGRMGWFGCTREDEDGNQEKGEELWRATVRALLDQYPEATAVLVDCHV